ncbi:peptidoglycan-binding protein [Nocardioides sp.]|uniref:L,D-transpeptidase family protein n=1 Tax=Nocardioides sp. TaxID=35761 RepID=UPI003566BB40
MRALRTLLVAVLAVALLTGGAYGAGWVLREPTGGAARGADADRGKVPPPRSGASDSPTPSPTDSPDPTEKPRPSIRLDADSSGTPVRALQARLHQIGWLPETTTGRYDPATEAAVRGFQAKRGLPTTGRVDQRTWRRLVAMTEQPTRAQLLNIFRPGPALLAPGASGEAVRDLQARLVAIQWLVGTVTGTYDAATTAAVRGFQAKREIPVTGEVDQRTLDRLHAMTSTPSHAAKHNLGNAPGSLDERCRTGRVLCIDKTSRTLRWVVDGDVLSTVDVRFGGASTPTREGRFRVEWKNADHVSKLYGSAMPYAMFFSRGQAVHYSSDFAAVGYNGASHGCVNVRDRSALAAVYDQVRVGDTVIVYWS